MRTATKVKDMPTPPFGGFAALYKLSEPIDGYDTAEVFPFVIVSATSVPYSGPETYIFPSNEQGEWGEMYELEGSFRGAMDHRAALLRAGYELVE